MIKRTEKVTENTFKKTNGLEWMDFTNSCHFGLKCSSPMGFFLSVDKFLSAEIFMVFDSHKEFHLRLSQRTNVYVLLMLYFSLFSAMHFNDPQCMNNEKHDSIEKAKQIQLKFRCKIVENLFLVFGKGIKMFHEFPSLDFWLSDFRRKSTKVGKEASAHQGFHQINKIVDKSLKRRIRAKFNSIG